MRCGRGFVALSGRKARKGLLALAGLLALLGRKARKVKKALLGLRVLLLNFKALLLRLQTFRQLRLPANFGLLAQRHLITDGFTMAHHGKMLVKLQLARKGRKARRGRKARKGLLALLVLLDKARICWITGTL